MRPPARLSQRFPRSASTAALLCLCSAVLLAAGCDLERPYDPLDEYESHVWTAATAGLQKIPRPGIDDDKPWPYEAHGLWPLFQDRAYFDGTASKSFAYPLWSQVTTPDGLRLSDLFLLFRDAQRDLPGGLTAQRTHFLWPIFQYRNKAWQTDYTLFPFIFWTSQVYPDARMHDDSTADDSAQLPLLPEPPIQHSSIIPGLDSPEGWQPPVIPGAPARSRSSLTRLARPYDPVRDHARDRLWIFPIFFFANDTRLGKDVALIPLGGSISNFIGKERVWFFAFPLWAATHEAAYDAQHFLWPIFAFWDGPGTGNGPGRNRSPGGPKAQDRRHGWRVLPLYSQDDWDNRQHRYSVLWPFWTSEDIGLDTKYPTHVRSFFPFFASSNSPRHKLTSFLTIFSHMSIFYNNGDWARSIWSVWPVFSFTHGDVAGLRFFPLFDARDDNESGYLTLLWPLFRAEHAVSYRETVDTFQFGLDPIALLTLLNEIVAGRVPLGRTEASQAPGLVRQTWWEVAQPHGDPLRFGREAEAQAYYSAQKVSYTWYDEGRVGKYWGPDAEELPPTNQALNFLYKKGEPPPIQEELARKACERLMLELPKGPGFAGAPGSVPTDASRPAGPVRGPQAYPLAPRKRTLADLEADASEPESGPDWSPTPPVRQEKTTDTLWPVIKYICTQRDDLSVALFTPIFFPDQDGAIESQWGSLWNLYLYQNSAEETGRERALLTWWRRDWNGPARHTELVGVFNYWRIDDQPNRSLFTLAGGWLWESYCSPRRSVHGNILFSVGTASDRPADWWLLGGLLGRDHTTDGERAWRILWMHW